MRKNYSSQQKKSCDPQVTNAELIQAVKEGTKEAILELLMSYPELMSGIMENTAEELESGKNT